MSRYSKQEWLGSVKKGRWNASASSKKDYRIKTQIFKHNFYLWNQAHAHVSKISTESNSRIILRNMKQLF